jgi:hypothetical protein
MPKHILASKTFWLHALTLIAVFCTALQGQEWLSDYPYATAIIASISAVVAIWVRFLTDSAVTLKRTGKGAILLAAILCGGQAVAAEPHDALAEVNAARKARGLRPFIRDDGLMRGALHVAKWRADRLIEGHTRNEFGGLPKGVKADAAGCAAWHGNDWGACCTYDNYRFAGAGWCYGRDQRRYMHIFVRR